MPNMRAYPKVSKGSEPTTRERGGSGGGSAPKVPGTRTAAQVSGGSISSSKANEAGQEVRVSPKPSQTAKG
jgi:hypothetical protein